VEDLDPRPPSAPPFFSPRGFTTVGGLALFLASDPADGFEPWVSDGTAAGTRRLADLCPGPCSSLLDPLWESGGRRVLDSGGQLWSTDGTSVGTVRLPGSAGPVLGVLANPERRIYGGPGTGRVGSAALWASDGTVAGTRRYFDLGDRNTEVWPGVGLGNVVLFVRDDREHGGRELWRTDGTAVGTGLLADILPGTNNSGSPLSSFPDSFVALDSGVALFAASGPSAGRELWVSDGTATGTNRLADLTPGSADSRFFAPPLGDGDRALFLAGPSSDGPQQLWVSDGTAGGTRALTSFTVPRAFGEPSDLFDAEVSRILQVVDQTPDGRIYFVADDGSAGREPWVSDGTPLGTHRLADVCPGPCSSSPKLATALPSGAMLFTADDGSSGSEPWITDGTAAGTRRLVDACHGPCTGTGLAQSFRSDGERVYFDAVAAPGGSRQVWVTDGTAAGTRPLTAFAAGEPGLQGGASDSGLVGGRLLFGAYDATHGTELWSSGGTPATTGPVGDFATLASRDSDPREMVAFGPRVAFVADDAAGTRLWVSDGTADGTLPVSELAPGLLERPLVVATLGSRILLSGDRRIWVSDGTAAGTTVLVDFAQAGSGVSARSVESVRVEAGRLPGRVVFFAADALWVSDGTAAGTGPIADLQPDRGINLGPSFASLGDRVLFAARRSADGTEGSLWITDGTSAGTHLVYDSDTPTDPFAPQQLTAAGGKVFFGAFGHAGGFATWVSDGTTAGTHLLEPGLVRPLSLTAVGSRVFLTALSTQPPRELWVSDGTAEGTVRAGDVPTPRGPAIVREAVAFGDRLAFVPDDGFYGHELWLSDGTPEGTARLVDLWPGRGNAEVADLAVAGDLLVFTASEPEGGRELWTSDGTAAGTMPLTDLLPGPGSSSPAATTVAGETLYFAATDGVTGRELWAIDFGDGGGGPAVPPPPGPWLTSPEVSGFRAKVRITPPGGASLLGSAVPVCIPETLCVAGAVAGRSEVFVRVVGPKPNGRLWPTLVKFTTSEVEVWIEQLSTGAVKYYRLEGARPGFDELPGLFDREGFEP